MNRYVLLLVAGFLLTTGLIKADNQGAVTTARKALLIGISDYRNWSDISAVRDLDSIEQVLLERGFAQHNILRLTNSDVTREKFIETFENLITNSGYGSVVHIHFSGHGMQIKDDNGDEADGLDEALIMYDAPLGLEKDFEAKILRDDKLGELIKKLSLKVGTIGQVVVSLDASNSGPDETEGVAGSRMVMARGGMIEEISSGNYENSPVILMSASNSNEISYEHNGLGIWTFAFIHAMRDSGVNTFVDLQLSIKSIVDSISGRITPSISGNVDRKIYQMGGIGQGLIFGSGDYIKSNFYVLSIGINQYNMPKYGNGGFTNCESDASSFSYTCQQQFYRYADTAKSKIVFYNLLGSEATLDNIDSAINEIINLAGKDDYFFFNFAGYSAKYTNPLGQDDIYFIPYTTEEIKNKGRLGELQTLPKSSFSISRLKDLLVFVPCKNQLIVTEAGSSERFAQLFTKALIETSPTIMDLEHRNRIVMVPKSFGMNYTTCNGRRIQAGPINYFLEEYSQAGKSLLRFFNEDRSKRNAAAYDFLKLEGKCNFPTGYVQVYFERDILEDLQFYMKDLNLSRGGRSKSKQVVEEAKKLGKKYALVLATSDYRLGAPTWSNLTNPITDGDRISSLLESNFDYEVTYLKNPSANDIIRSLDSLSKRMSVNDQFVMFLAGHGDYDPSLFDDGFVVLSESLPLTKDPYRRTYLPFTQLGNIIDNLPCNQVLMMVDVCFGGAFDQRLSGGQMRSRQGIYGDMSNEEMIQSKIDKRTRIVLSSGSLNEVPDGYRGKHSPFAFHMISLLEDGGGDQGMIMSSQLYEKVRRLPSKPFLGQLDSNEPGSEFFLIGK